MKNKIMTGSEAVSLIKDGDTLVTAAAGLIGYPEYLVKCLVERYQKTQSPRGLTLVSGCGHAVWDERGDSRFALPGLLKRHICTHPDAAPPLRKMLENNEVECYILPQGVLNQLYRASAAKRPYHFENRSRHLCRSPARRRKVNDAAKARKIYGTDQY